MTRPLSLLLCLLLAAGQPVFAQSAQNTGFPVVSDPALSAPGRFRPIHLRSLSYDAAGNTFKLLLDAGDVKAPADRIEETSRELLRFFLTGLALPDEKFWVNLRPDSPDSVIDPAVARTDIGRILLEADVQLKKDAAAMTSPATGKGREYWTRLYEKAEELFGAGATAVPAMARPWIVPDEIIVHENAGGAYIDKATLRVMLECDYLKGGPGEFPGDPRLKELNEFSARLMRELVIPALTREINTAARYSRLRQVYYSLILAQWFKQRFRGREGAVCAAIDRGDLRGLMSREKWSPASCFAEYRRSFREGEYNISETVSGAAGRAVRSYCSGGISFYGNAGIAAKLGNAFPSGELIAPGTKPYLKAVDVYAAEDGWNVRVREGAGYDGQAGPVGNVRTVRDGGEARESLAGQAVAKLNREIPAAEAEALLDTAAQLKNDDVYRFLSDRLRELDMPGARVYFAPLANHPVFRNIIAEIPASDPRYAGLPQIILNAHMDIVPDKGKEDPAQSHGYRVVSKERGQRSVAAGALDDRAGVSAILLALRLLKDTPHGPLKVIFTDQEETGLRGANDLVNKYDRRAQGYETLFDNAKVVIIVDGPLVWVNDPGLGREDAAWFRNPFVVSRVSLTARSEHISEVVSAAMQRVGFGDFRQPRFTNNGNGDYKAFASVYDRDRQKSLPFLYVRAPYIDGNPEKDDLDMHSGKEWVDIDNHLIPISRWLAEMVAGFTDDMAASGGVSGQKDGGVPAETGKPGGVDFRALPIVTHAVGDLREMMSRMALPGRDLAKESQSVRRLLDAGILPSSDRARTYVGATCAGAGDTGELGEVSAFITDMLRLEEEQCRPTDPFVRDILVVLSAGTGPQEMRSLLAPD